MEAISDNGQESDSSLLQIQKKEESIMIQHAIDQLREEERVVITMYYLQELSIREITEITDWTQSNIKIKLFRARNNLREIMSGAHYKSLHL